MSGAGDFSASFRARACVTHMTLSVCSRVFPWQIGFRGLRKDSSRLLNNAISENTSLWPNWQSSAAPV